MAQQPIDVAITMRARQAVSLRARKLSYQEIADQCGYASAGAAHNAVQRELQHYRSTAVEEYRHEECLTLDRLQQICFEILDDTKHPQRLAAVQACLAVQKRRADLLGLDVVVEQAGIVNATIVREVPSNYIQIAPVDIAEVAS